MSFLMVRSPADIYRKDGSLDYNRIFGLQKRQYRESIILSDTVPGNSGKLGRVSISNLGHFFSLSITGTFETVATSGAIVDTGLSYLSGQLIDGAGNKKLFNDRIPLDLFLSPGRRKSSTSTTVVADPVGNSLFYPIEFEYLWTANSDILFDVQNTSDQNLDYELVFHGYRIIAPR